MPDPAAEVRAQGSTDVSAEASVDVPSRDAMHDLGRRLAGVLRAGDVLVLSGELGSGKTTLTQGIGQGLGVRGPVTSPTFVIARVHPSEVGGPPLVHVDAYRLADLAEVDDLDLDASLEDSVTVVEWGQGLVEGLSGDRLEISLERPPAVVGDAVRGEDGDAVDGEDADEPRAVRLSAVGERWADVDLAELIGSDVRQSPPL